jgi:hypothetical protein
MHSRPTPTEANFSSEGLNLSAFWEYDDGGRSQHFRGSAGDCVTRAIAIASGRPYLDVYDEIRAFAKQFEKGRARAKKSNPRTGVHKDVKRRYLESRGWMWIPTMHIGTGCTVHLNPSELPPGRLIVALSRHSVAVIDGVIRDTYDPSRNGTRCVYGYFQQLN